jgi:hypothetical protein
MRIAKWRVRVWMLGAIAIVIAVGIAWIPEAWVKHEMSSPRGARVDVVSANTAPARALAERSASSDPPSADVTHPPDLATESIGHAEPYPVNLDALRARLPDNRYWALGAPTSDPVVAGARAERARRDNTAFGRIQASEATPGEIRAYYAERRAISKDYLELAELVLAEQGDRLPERDRGMFELGATLHRARLRQIDRDEADALARRSNRQSGP